MTSLFKIIKDLSETCDSIKFVRVDSDSNNHTLVLLVTINKNSKIDNAIKILKDEKTSISFFESKTNW